MSTSDRTHETVSDAQLDDRDARALTECMTVLPEGGNIFSVIGENGNGEHRVDARGDRCTCQDYEYNLPTEDGRETCKHRARVAFATGERAIPGWINLDAVDDLLGDQLDSEPRVAATDGGVVDVGQQQSIDDVDVEDECEDCAKLPEGWPCAECFIVDDKPIEAGGA